MAERFRRKSTVVEAVQWRGDNADELAAFCGSDFEVLDEPSGDDPEATAAVLTSQHSSWVLVYTGDWILREPDGSGFYPCREAIFAQTYEVTGG